MYGVNPLYHCIVYYILYDAMHNAHPMTYDAIAVKDVRRYESNGQTMRVTDVTYVTYSHSRDVR
jgi:hypothetical protein